MQSLVWRGQVAPIAQDRDNELGIPRERDWRVKSESSVKQARDVEAPRKNRRASPPGGLEFVSRLKLGELDVSGLLAAAAAIILNLEGDFVALVQRRHA